MELQQLRQNLTVTCANQHSAQMLLGLLKKSSHLGRRIIMDLSEPKKNTAVMEAASRNIEIKARLGSDEEFEKRVKIARHLTGTDGQIIEQHDIFYNVREGRLKLRFLIVSKLRILHTAKLTVYRFVYTLVRRTNHRSSSNTLGRTAPVRNCRSST